MEKPIRLGVVGYGRRGANLFRYASAKMENIVPAAVCEIDPGKLDKAQAAHPDTKCFTDFDEMLDSGAIDALLVETPASCHAEFCRKALLKNIHVLSDIPPVTDYAEAEKLWEAGGKSKALFMTGANPNMCAWIDTVIDLREKGLLGDPYYIECEYIHDCRYLWKTTPWRVNMEPVKYCTHDLGPVLRIIDEDIVSVSCFDTGSHVNKAEGQHDAMAALFRTSSNIVIRFLCSFINNRPRPGHQIRIYATKGYFEDIPPYLVKDDARFVFYSTELHALEDMVPFKISNVSPEYKQFTGAGHGGIDHVMLDRFFKAVRSGGPPPVSLRDGIRMSLPGIFAAESARRNGELVKIRYPWDS